MRYWFYEWIYQIAKCIALKCNSIFRRCISVMKNMVNRQKEWLKEKS